MTAAMLFISRITAPEWPSLKRKGGSKQMHLGIDRIRKAWHSAFAAFLFKLAIREP